MTDPATELTRLFESKEAGHIVGPCAASAYRHAVRRQIRSLSEAQGGAVAAPILDRLVSDGGRRSDGRRDDIERAAVRSGRLP
ncbi:hypothetical protein Q8W71_31295 [Methylobacterium sp. NEAU 140]|uniref:hypothetical protein n=1 Tax=Methylobacterium sp. NEAU 140 TaxID=3064945 RepID=UPI00273513EC|nr:hypothetical protein [Methylobacterium sp. NEAU 140]MDP4027078.1 hypothetical protein [Methylobacterium sp. NEAU 140]